MQQFYLRLHNTTQISCFNTAEVKKVNFTEGLTPNRDGLCPAQNFETCLQFAPHTVSAAKHLPGQTFFRKYLHLETNGDGSWLWTFLIKERSQKLCIDINDQWLINSLQAWKKSHNRRWRTYVHKVCFKLFKLLFL